MRNMIRVQADTNIPVWIGADSTDDFGVCAIGVQHPGRDIEVAMLKLNLAAFTSRAIFQLAERGILYEEPTSVVALNCLRQGDVALDIGAHVGFFSTLFRLAVGETGRVFAFEPLPDTYRNLLFNVVHNGFFNVIPIPVALAEQSGTFFLHKNKDNEGASSLLEGQSGQEEGAIYPTQVMCLDEFFEGNLPKAPRLIKIDVEGVELMLLRGASKWFSRQPPDVVICELNDGALATGGATEWDLRRYFEVRGYRCAVINNRSGLDMRGAKYYRYLASDEISRPEGNIYVHNLMFVREGSGVYPEPSW